MQSQTNENCASIKNLSKVITDPRSYEELSEIVFGDGNCFNESEVRKRFYGIKRAIEIFENDGEDRVATRVLAISDAHVPFNTHQGNSRALPCLLPPMQL